MAELADAADSKSAGLRPLGVRLPLPAPTFTDRFWNVEVLRLALLAQDFACGLGRPQKRLKFDSLSRHQPNVPYAVQVFPPQPKSSNISDYGIKHRLPTKDRPG